MFVNNFRKEAFEMGAEMFYIPHTTTVWVLLSAFCGNRRFCLESDC